MLSLATLLLKWMVDRMGAEEACSKGGELFPELCGTSVGAQGVTYLLLGSLPAQHRWPCCGQPGGCQCFRKKLKQLLS